MTTRLQTKIEQAETKLKQLKAQAAAKAARAKAAESKKARQDDTRRKILLGAWLISEVSKLGRGELTITNASLNTSLDAYLVKDADRALFGLGLSRIEDPDRITTHSPD